MFEIVTGLTSGVAPNIVNNVLSVARSAADYWGRYIDASAATVTIEISFTALDDTSLAQGGTDLYFDHSAGGLDYYEPMTIVELNGGGDLNGTDPDIYIDIDTGELNANQFGFGQIIDGVSIGQSGKYDLWTILVHEIGHGLGLLTFLDQTTTDRTTFDQFVTTSGGYQFNSTDPDYPLIALDSSIAHLTSGVLGPAIGTNDARYISQADLAIFSTIGAPVLTPTNGNDRLGGFGDPLVLIDALDGDDTLLGVPGNDSFFGGAGNDSLSGSLGDDTLGGGAGDDWLVGGAGADMLDGGPGRDTADYSGAAAGVTIKIWNNSGQGDIATGDTLTKIENIIGSDFNDRLIGIFNADNYLAGAGGDDYIDGLGGDDTIDGGNGDDRLIGGAGADDLRGAAGFDIVSYNVSAKGVTVRLWEQIGRVGDAQGDVLNSIEGLIGSQHGDSLEGDDSNNVLQGNGGDDTLFGMKGWDFINGGNGDDLIVGGPGADTLKGWNGNDTFLFAPAFGADTITDFSAGAAGGDVIRFKNPAAAFDTFAELMAAASQQGGDTLIDLGGGNSITLAGVFKSDLDQGDFIFG
ncbi:MAG: hypothetical protein KDD85_09890 [Parvularculaceae bacterium]|nr:hypothetical protein [Parvularculaceae bacterium]